MKIHLPCNITRITAKQKKKKLHNILQVFCMYLVFVFFNIKCKQNNTHVLNRKTTNDDDDAVYKYKYKKRILKLLQKYYTF